jgi:hypothetical protein
MATKKSKDETKPRKSVPVHMGEDQKENGRNFAKVVTSPELAAYRVINGAELKSGMGEHIDVPTLLGELRDHAAAVHGGDMKKAEAMLISQATALQSLFARLAERGMSCEHVPGFEANMRMALRAQSQCRATLETLATIKNPPVIFAKQANIANGHQQVNNGIPAPATHAGENKNQQNELLEAQNGSETLDSRATGETGGKDKAMAALD